MSRGPDADTQLERALLAGAVAAGCAVRIDAASCERWASATFSGTRHVLSLSGDASPAIEQWLIGLPEAEFALRGHLVADVSVEAVRRAGGKVTALVEALTVEER